jgi:hypothetical protein
MKSKAVMFIHGIGPQPQGYSDALWNVLWQDEDPERAVKYEVFYYDIFDSINAKLEMDKIMKENRISAVLDTVIKSASTTTMIKEAVTDVLKNTAAHVFYFLMIGDVTYAVLSRFKRKLIDIIEDARAHGCPVQDLGISIVSHSLGTVVAYTGLHAIIGEQGIGLQDDVRIDNLFTLASPLMLIKNVADQLRVQVPYMTNRLDKPREWDPAKKIYASNVRRWFSYRHERDSVASRIPLTGTFLDNIDQTPFRFDTQVDKVHAFENYLMQARDVIIKNIRGS